MSIIFIRGDKQRSRLASLASQFVPENISYTTGFKFAAVIAITIAAQPFQASMQQAAAGQVVCGVAALDCITPSGDDIINGTVDINDLGTGSVGSDEIVDGSIQEIDLGNSQVTTNKINDLAVTTGKINDLAVTTGKINDLAVTTGKINDLAVTTAKINDLAVTTAKINDLAVTTAKINDLAVTTAKINDLAVTTAKIDNSAVTTAKINDLAVTTAKINNQAVTTAKIADSAVTTNKINNLAVTTNKIADGAVTFNKLAPDVQNRITGLESDVQDLKGGVAMAMAIANAPVILDGDKTFSLSVGLGFYDSETAGAFKGAIRLAPNTILQGSLAYSDDEVGGGVGIGIGF